MIVRLELPLSAELSAVQRFKQRISEESSPLELPFKDFTKQGMSLFYALR